MIEAMEQLIVNSINNRWTKQIDLRKEIQLDRVAESFRVICSSRASILSIITEIKDKGCNEELMDKLKKQMEEIYIWITEDSIKTLIDKYEAPIKDKEKEARYKAEISKIEKFLQQFKCDLITSTINKLLKFHNIERR